MLSRSSATNTMKTLRRGNAKPMLLDGELVDQAKRGDTRAFEELVRRYQNQVFRFALYALPSRQDAEDVAQETFIAAYRHIGRFRGDASLNTWLMSIARSKVAGWYRGRKVDVDISAISELADGDSETAVEHMEIRSAVAALPRPYREIVVLRYVNQFDVREIAAATGLSPTAAASRLHRARGMLRSALSDTRQQEVCRDEL
jgi:RNA polymerase sigma-70 factor, ECF subfamily